MDAVAANQVLGEEIRWIFFTAYLEQFKGFTAHFLLNPQTLGINVSEFAEALPPADSYGCCAVCPDTHRKFYTYVFQ